MKLHSLPSNRRSPHSVEALAATDRVNVLSHELRTPLAVISGYAQVLREEVEPDKMALVQPILDNVERLQGVISSLLDWETWSSDPVIPQNCDVYELVSTVLENFRASALSKSLRIEFENPEHRLASYSVSESIRAVVAQLLSNAVKFSDQGSIRVVIEHTAQVVAIRIEDEGKGIGNSNKNLFAAFVQESDGLNRQYEGLGLGLAVAQKHATSLKGQITLENRESKGAVAVFTFPRFASRKEHAATNQPTHQTGLRRAA